MKNGVVCISLDFEKFWGLHDLVPQVQVNKFKEVSTIVNRLLDLFEQYNIHCTWATVGLLSFKNIEELEAITSTIKIQYSNALHTPYPISKHSITESNSTSFFALNEINKIKGTSGQEFASHTFSHYYCLETGQTAQDFENDLLLFEKHAGQVKSIVFPRNQVNINYLKLCAERGIKAYRGNQQQWFWSNSTVNNESIFKKISRTADAYIKLRKNQFTSWKSIEKNANDLVNIPANRFLRPYKSPLFLEKLKMRRLKKELLSAAKSEQIYHLWWHPHNFTDYMEENFQQLELLLQYINELRSKFGFESLNMNEILQKVD
ncbi:MAG: polysaccharide deacetylase [Putridiphycobacter sp.]|nr:polysaccharide deacetylase [Putridiphycobacter sp.]